MPYNPPQNIRQRAYQKAMEYLAEGREDRATAIEIAYGGWREADKSDEQSAIRKPRGEICPACLNPYHPRKLCYEMKEGLWAIVKDKNKQNDKAKRWARVKLGLND
jgi:hypothetical protein